ncbi:MAG: M12 family metallopeptidase [Alphaproteobacteria bacterium]|nr:M12 family metallopeptidase [Alphaproteobacteria bacterium]
MGHKTRFANRVWPRGIVPYEIGPALSTTMRGSIIRAVAYWNRTTHFRIIPRSPSDAQFMRFIPGPGCSSNIGYQARGTHLVRLDPGCSENKVRHEIGHRIGLLHEHVRRDRDEFVRIDFDNIAEGKEGNFERDDRGELCGDYDFRSLMHYQADAFQRPADYAWPTTWSGAAGYEIGGESFVVIFNTTTRAWCRYRVDQDGGLDEIGTGFFERRWTDIQHCQIGRRLFEFRFRRNNGRYEMVPLEADGLRGSGLLHGRFAGPHTWAAPGFFQAPSEPRLVMFRNVRPGLPLALQVGAARLEIYKVDRLGQIIFPPTDTPSNQRADHVVTIRDEADRDFAVLVRLENRSTRLFEIRKDQLSDNLNDMGVMLGSPRWGPSAWTHFDLLRSNNGYRVVTYRSRTGTVTIGSLPDNGVRSFNTARPTDSMSVEPRYNVFQGYHVGNRYHVLMIRNRRSRSVGRILDINSGSSTIDGYVTIPGATVVRFDSDDPDLGSTGILTTGDIEAANSLCQSNLHCHRVAGDGRIGERIFVDHDTVDVDDAHGMETTSGRFVALGNRTAGSWTVRLVRREGQFFEGAVPVAGFPAWTASTTAQSDNRTHLYLHDSASGNLSWFLFRGRPFDVGGQQSGTGFGAFTHIENFSIGDGRFLFFYNRNNGEGAVVSIGPDGAVDSDDLTPVDGLRGGWDDVCVYTRGSTAQVIFVRQNRRPEIWRAAEDGLSFTEVENLPDMGRGWTSCAHLPTINTLVLYRQRDGLMCVWSINNSGDPEVVIQDREELPVWQSMTAYRATRGPRLLMLCQRWS